MRLRDHMDYVSDWFAGQGIDYNYAHASEVNFILVYRFRSDFHKQDRCA